MLTSLLLLLGGAGAWFISTLAAGGAATMLLPLVGWILGANAVAPVVSIASIIANPSRVWLFRTHVDRRVLRYLVPGSLSGAVVGGYFFSQLSLSALQLCLGIFLLANAIRLAGERFTPSFKTEAWYFLPAAFTVSGISGITGASGPLLNPFLFNFGLDQDAIVATKALNSMITQTGKLATYLVTGALTVQSVEAGAILGLGAFIGVLGAKAHLARIGAVRFRRYTAVVLSLAGLQLLYQGLHVA